MDGTPFTIRSNLFMHQQAGLLALGSTGGGQPSHRGFITAPGSGRPKPQHPPSPITAAGPPRILTGFRIAWGVV